MLNNGDCCKALYPLTSAFKIEWRAAGGLLSPARRVVQSGGEQRPVFL